MPGACPQDPTGHREGNSRHLCFVATNRGLVAQLSGASSGYLGGAELQVTFTGEELARRGWDVTIIVGDEGQEPLMEVNGMRLIKAYRQGGRFLPWILWQRSQQLRRAFAIAQADTYILHGVSWQASLIAEYCAFREKTRFVFWAASNTDPMCLERGKSRIPWWQRGMAYRGMTLADVIIAQTDCQAEIVRQYLKRDAVVIRYVWPYGVNVRPVPLEPMILWVANLRAVKRPEIVLEIAKHLPETRFVMVGGAVRKHERYYDHLMQQAEAIPNLTCTGFLPFAEADRLFEQATVFLNTSTVEGFPNTYLQAWSRGVPVVGSFDPDEAICRHGLGVHFSTIQEAVEALRTLCVPESEALQAIGARATKYIQENHSTDVVIGRLEALLKSP